MLTPAELDELENTYVTRESRVPLREFTALLAAARRDADVRTLDEWCSSEDNYLVQLIDSGQDDKAGGRYSVKLDTVYGDDSEERYYRGPTPAAARHSAAESLRKEPADG